jgi:hypothetical protein
MGSRPDGESPEGRAVTRASFVTLLLPLFTTQMFAPSKATPDGHECLAKGQVLSDARRLCHRTPVGMHRIERALGA